jgi:hypothetical protein
LRRLGYEFKKSKFYQDAESGLLPIQPDGSVMHSDLIRYALSFGLTVQDGLSGSLQPPAPFTRFLDDRACRMWLLDCLHPEEVRCPRCGKAEEKSWKIERFFELRQIHCSGCGKEFHGLMTLFGGSRITPEQVVLMLFLWQLGKPSEDVALHVGLSVTSVRKWQGKLQEWLAGSRS